MGAPRKFDYDEAAAMRAEGATYAEIGRRLGVSESRVAQVLNPAIGARAAARARAWQSEGRCDDCGGQMWRTGDTRRCVACAAVARATTVRPSDLRCVRCGEWKPDEAFPHDRANLGARRGRHGFCRSCQTEARRAYRDRNRVPCSHGCGRMVLHERRDPAKPHECKSCAARRVRAAQRAGAAA